MSAGQSIPFDGGPVVVRGALDLHPTERGLLPRRLPAWTRAQYADGLIDAVSSCTSGVRLAFRTSSPWVELDVHTLTIHVATRPFVDPGFDLVIGGPGGSDPVLQRLATGSVWTVEPLDPANLAFRQGDVGTVRFDLSVDLDRRDASGGEIDVEIWLPTAASCELVDLRIASDASISAPTVGDVRWLHHGSSISHCMDVDRPTDSWTVIAAAKAGVELLNLGLGGQCQLDQFMARTIRDQLADLISLKLGINLMNAASMTMRSFGPAVHGFLDTIRDGHPTTPLLVVSPIWCPLVEDHVGPTVPQPGNVFGTIDLPPQTELTGLTTARIRRTLADIVSVRRAAGDDRLHFLDGNELFGQADEAHLYDRLHPDPAGYRLIGERFAATAFGPTGAFAAAMGRP